MPHARTTALVLGLLAAVAAWRGLRRATTPAPVVAPADVHLRRRRARRGAGRRGRRRPRRGRRSPGAADRLEAARTVALYCRLVEAGQFARAGELLRAPPALVAARARAASRRFHFRSARVYAAPDARTLVLKARVRVRAGRGRPLPDGLAILFFTLGRVGSTVGGWLITAVTTSP